MHYYYTDRFWATLICTTSTTLTDFERLLFALLLLHWWILSDSYLHYYYYTDRFWTTFICPTTTTLWQILNESFIYSTTTTTLTDFERLLFALLLLQWWILSDPYLHYYFYTDRFWTTLICPTTTTLTDFERVFYLHHHSLTYFCFICTSTTTTLYQILNEYFICTTTLKLCNIY